MNLIADCLTAVGKHIYEMAWLWDTGYVWSNLIWGINGHMFVNCCLQQIVSSQWKNILLQNNQYIWNALQQMNLKSINLRNILVFDRNKIY